MFRRSFLAVASASLVNGLGRAAEALDNGPRATGGRIDNGPAAPPVRVPANIITTATRRPHGHTHTCSAGHTWDHDENAGHTCRATVGFDADGRPKICGRAQYVQDSPPRMVRVESIMKTDIGPGVTYRGSSVTAPPAEPVIEKTFKLGASSGCANGQCNTSRNYVLPWRR